jgi:hypothetical protein
LIEESSVGIEEAAIETTSLPFGLALKVGQFFADFTRLGKVHPHERPFTDGPPSVDAIIGGETRARGVELSWVPPLPHYMRFTLGAVDGMGHEVPSATESFEELGGGEDEHGHAHGESAFYDDDHRSFGDLMFYGRAATVFEFGDAMLNVGADYASSNDGARRRIASADAKFEWRGTGNDLLTAGGEVLWGEKRGRLTDEALFDGGPVFANSRGHGGYAFIKYRFGKMWEPGIRYDQLRSSGFEQLDTAADGEADSLGQFRDMRHTYSAFLTYHATEFQKFRLTLNYIDSEREPDDLQALLQWSIILGPHKHSFQP